MKNDKNTANKPMRVVAEWYADLHSNYEYGGEYVIRHADGTNWYSPNGETWHDCDGNDVSAPKHAVGIDFIGGRLDGTYTMFFA
jgi:hypothetical protein